jgi:choloylglycine hydrolase
MKRLLILLCATALGITAVPEAQPCSNVILSPDKTLNNQVVSARTLDFPGVYGYETQWVKVPRGMTWTSNDSLFQPGRQWQNAFGFVGMDMLSSFTAFSPLQRRIFLDGLNEKGLSAAWLWLDEASFPIPNSRDPEGLLYADLVAWILGQYQTVADVKSALTAAAPHICSSELLVAMDKAFPLHLVVHDGEGHSMIVEWHFDSVGQPQPTMHLYDGTQVDFVGVMTNSPVYPEHLTKLAQYGDITNTNALEGLPGGFDSPSRFVRLAKIREFLDDQPLVPVPDPGPPSAVAQALHAINNVDLGHGVDYDPLDPVNIQNNLGVYQETGVTLVRDHTQRVIFFKGLHNQSLRMIDLKTMSFDLAAGGEAAIPADILPDPEIEPSQFDRYAQAEDVTAQLAAPDYRYYLIDGGDLDFRLDLSLMIQVADADKGKLGMGFVYGYDQNNNFWNWQGEAEGWKRVPQDEIKPFGVGELQTTKVNNVFVGLLAKEWAGSRILAGYGTSLAEMLLSGKSQQVFMIQEGPRLSPNE